jgi:hypothetical protein
MSLTINPTNTIYNSNKKRLFTFPNNTTLDNIIPDLWNIIIGYMDVAPFIIGLKSANYPGYRELKNGEFDKYRHKILKYYLINNGMDNIFNLYLNGAILLIDGCNILTEEGTIKCDDNNAQIRIRYSNELFRGDIYKSIDKPHNLYQYVVFMVFDP